MITYETALLRYAARIVNNPVTAEDVVQTVFIKLFRNWESLHLNESQIKAWLYRVTHNQAVDFIRKESRLKLLHERHAEEEAIRQENRPENTDDEAERMDRVLEEIRQLPSREQQVLLLRLQEGLSYKEIAEVTGRSMGNVGNILHHAVKHISERMMTEDGDRKIEVGGRNENGIRRGGKTFHPLKKSGRS